MAVGLFIAIVRDDFWGVTKHESVRGFVFDVATGKLNEVTL